MFFSWGRSSVDTAQADSYFSEAYACIEQGLCYDEINDYENTRGMYDRGLNLIKEGEKSKNAKKSELYSSLMEAKKSVENRVKVLKKEGPKKAQTQPPAIVVNGASKNGPPPDYEKVVGSEKDTENIREKLDSAGTREADLIYFLPDGVQLFTINGDTTTAPTYPTSLQIFKLNSSEGEHSKADSNEPLAFIQVGPWVYPLMKGKMPMLHNDYGAYIVHNPVPENPDMLVAILLPPDLDAKLEKEFRDVLSEYVEIREQEVKKELTPEENERLSRKIAKFLIKTGEKVADGVQTTSVKMSSYVENRGQKYREGLQEGEGITVSPTVKSGVVYLHKGSKVVAKCTRYLLDKIGDMGVAVGTKIANTANDRFGDGKGGGLITGTIKGSKTLCRSIANETVKHVKVKYGDDASQTTEHALHAAGHSGLAAFQIWDLGPRSIAGRMARKAGIQFVKDVDHHRKYEPGASTSSAGPLDEKKKL
ncbi:hypothetical protein WR25_10411 [Diploscapter pachys]|uniref:Inheritance of peroxisomes protein 1 n=1 Tax=Diploscapter pachys TaxID=2018661 RepID=A0A2A2JLQ9_9BILA|nr:hypothetical protein WR25_10411 [Diploscapter pachys]